MNEIPVTRATKEYDRNYNGTLSVEEFKTVPLNEAIPALEAAFEGRDDEQAREVAKRFIEARPDESEFLKKLLWIPKWNRLFSNQPEKLSLGMRRQETRATAFMKIFGFPKPYWPLPEWTVYSSSIVPTLSFMNLAKNEQLKELSKLLNDDNPTVLAMTADAYIRLAPSLSVEVSQLGLVDFNEVTRILEILQRPPKSMGINPFRDPETIREVHSKVAPLLNPPDAQMLATLLVSFNPYEDSKLAEALIALASLTNTKALNMQILEKLFSYPKPYVRWAAIKIGEIATLDSSLLNHCQSENAIWKLWQDPSPVVREQAYRTFRKRCGHITISLRERLDLLKQFRNLYFEERDSEVRKEISKTSRTLRLKRIYKRAFRKTPIAPKKTDPTDTDDWKIR